MAILQLKKYKYDWRLSLGYENDYREPALEKLLTAIYCYSPPVLQYFVYNVAAKTLPVWERYNENAGPREALLLIKHYIQGIINNEGLVEFIVPVTEGYHGDNGVETGAAAYAIAMAAAFMCDENILNAVSSIAHAPLAVKAYEDEYKVFYHWFFDVAIPISLEQRFMTPHELGRFEYDKFALDVYKSLSEEAV